MKPQTLGPASLAVFCKTAILKNSTNILRSHETGKLSNHNGKLTKKIDTSLDFSVSYSSAVFCSLSVTGLFLWIYRSDQSFQIRVINTLLGLTLASPEFFFRGRTFTHSFLMYPFPTPWKHQKTLWVFDVFRGYRKGAWGRNALKN